MPTPADTKTLIKKTLARIDKEIPYIDIKEYSHNIIGLQLAMLTRICSKEQMKKIVIERGLDKMGWERLIQ
jgi:hypothetical protein